MNPCSGQVKDGQVTATNSPESIPGQLSAGSKGSTKPRNHAVARPVKSISNAQPNTRHRGLS